MTACTVCDAEFYSTTPCTNTTNRVCAACAPRCTADEYQDVACTLHSDRVCKPLQKNLTVSFAMAAPIQNVSEVNLAGYAAATAASLNIDPQYVTASLTPPENSLAARPPPAVVQAPAADQRQHLLHYQHSDAERHGGAGQQHGAH
jgi:hypothetical protein